MGLGLGMGMSMAIICPVCDTNAGDSDEHNPECPRAKLAAAVRDQILYECPKCRGRVYDTTDDFLECRKCGTTYSRGLACATTEEVFLHMLNPTEDYHKAFVLPDKGNGDKFRIDLLRKRLKAEEKSWRK